MALGPQVEPVGSNANGAADKRRLASLGVTPDDELLYRMLLSRPNATVADLVGATGWDAARVRRRTRSLEKRGLLTRVPSRPVRFTPAPPDVAIEVLALQRQEEIERARLAAASLTEEFHLARHGEGGPPVQVLSGRAAITQSLLQTQESTRHELLILDRPPYISPPVDEQTAVQRKLLERGVRHRTIYDHRSLETPGQLALCRELALLGEEGRVLAEVPLKMVIADRRIALVPYVHPGEREVMVLRTSALLDALVVFFELLWQRAVPLRSTGPRSPSPSPYARALSPDDENLLALSASGLTDQAIARRLGVAQRTVERRMRRIMNVLGARTRFQAGLQAGQRGVLGGGPPGAG